MNLLFFSGGTAAANHSLNNELTQHIGSRARITYTPSRSTGAAPYFEQFQRDKRRFGIKQFVYFAADQHFSRSQLTDAFASEAIFLSGGNTFAFLQSLRTSALLEKLSSFAQRGGTLLGESAGSLILTPRINLAGYVPGESDPNEVRLKNLRSLDLVPFEVYPHFIGSRISITYLKKYSEKTKIPVFAFPDGSGVAVRGSVLSFHGSVTCFSQGKKLQLA